MLDIVALLVKLAIGILNIKIYVLLYHMNIKIVKMATLIKMVKIIKILRMLISNKTTNAYTAIDTGKWKVAGRAIR